MPNNLIEEAKQWLKDNPWNEHMAVDLAQFTQLKLSVVADELDGLWIQAKSEEEFVNLVGRYSKQLRNTDHAEICPNCPHEAHGDEMCFTECINCGELVWREAGKLDKPSKGEACGCSFGCEL